MKKEFEKVCENIYGKVNTVQECKDEFVMFIDTLCRKPIVDIIYPKGNKRNLVDIKMIESCKGSTIAVVLESPHRFEYDSSGQSVGPARGKTGENLSKYLLKKIKNVGIHGRYKIVLIEAIPFQCSNGLRPINKKKRDAVFQYMWKNGGESYFIQRLKSHDPEIIINACTGGVSNINDPNSLNCIVDAAIKQVPCENYFYCPHPSSLWFILSNLKKRK